MKEKIPSITFTSTRRVRYPILEGFRRFRLISDSSVPLYPIIRAQSVISRTRDVWNFKP